MSAWTQRPEPDALTEAFWRVAAGVFLLVVLPVLLLAAVALKLTGRGPVFTRRARSFRGRTVQLIEFYTPNAKSDRLLDRWLGCRELPHVLNACAGQI